MGQRVTQRVTPSFDVVVVGLGVTSIQLIRRLEEAGASYCVITADAFGIWKKLAEAGENFDLVTTIESTNFHDWSFSYEFPFYTAAEYYEKLLELLTPRILENVTFAKVSKAQWADGRWRVLGEGGKLLAECSRLVSSIGFEPDPDILQNLRRANETRDATVLVRGFSDTANMYISRLMLHNNRVVIASDHFSTLDKLADVGLRYPDGSTHWLPFDQLEPFHHYTSHGETWSDWAAWWQHIAPFRGPKLLGRLWRWRSGLSKLYDTYAYEQTLPGNTLLSHVRYKGIPAGVMLPVKYWPVDAYFDYFRTHSDHMLSSRAFLNDVFFFMTIGLVKLFPRRQVIDLGHGTYRLGDGSVIRPDLTLDSGRATRRCLPIEVDGTLLEYEYEKHLYGVWSPERPNLFFLGGTRPTTGSFGSLGEMMSLLVYELLFVCAFRERLTAEFPSLLADWCHTYLHAPRSCEGIVETDWAGQCCERVGRLLGTALRNPLSWKELWLSFTQRGLLHAYVAASDNMLRYTINGKYAVPGAREKYEAQGNDLSVPESTRIQFELLLPYVVSLNALLVICQDAPAAACVVMLVALTLVWCLPSTVGAVCKVPAHIFRVLVLPISSYMSDYFLYRILIPLGLLANAYYCHVAIATALALALLPLCWSRVFFFPLPLSVSPMHCALALLTIWLAAALHAPISEAGGDAMATVLVRGGLIVGLLAWTADAFATFCVAPRLIFNDPRGKGKYREQYERYVEEYRRIEERCSGKAKSNGHGQSKAARGQGL